MARKDKSAHNAYMREYVKKRCRKRRKLAEKLLGGKCSVCGSKENLDIDHINPETKVLGSDRMWTAAEDKFLLELQKCQLLCRSCHEDKPRRTMVFKKIREFMGGP